MKNTTSQTGSTVYWVGIDDHADKIVVTVLKDWDDAPYERFELGSDEKSLGRLMRKLRAYNGSVRCVYEAGPCGFTLYRRLLASGISCEVAAPGLTPKKSGNRVKTDRLDSKQLAILFRGGMLTAIEVPDERREALRDLVRAREDALESLSVAKNRLGKFLLRHGHRYREGTTWTERHWKWIRAIRFEQEYSAQALESYIAAVENAEAVFRRTTEMVTAAAESVASIVDAYCVLRGIDRLSAITIYSELGDLRRFRTAPQMMAAVGLVPSESSSGNSERRSGITKTGNAHVRRILVEAAWHARHRPNVSRRLRDRRANQPEERIRIAREADTRLHRKLRKMIWRRKRPTVAVIAVARELAGFVWAIGQTL